MSYLGSWKIDDWVTFAVNTHNASTGAAANADAAPSYSVYEDETATAIATGTMTQLDSKTGFYTERIQLTTAIGYEKGKSYTIYITATVSSVAGSVSHTLQIEAEVDANVVSDKTGYTATASAIAANAINAAAIATGAIDADAIATDAITAAKIATDAIDADALASDAVTEIQSGLATSANQTTILNRLGDFAGTGLNTIKGFFQALFRKDSGVTGASTPSEINELENGQTGTYDGATDSLEASIDTRSTLQQIEDQILNATRASHTTQGSIGEAFVPVVSFTVGSGSTTTVIETDLTETTVNHYVGKEVHFITGPLAGATYPVTAYSATGQITVPTMTDAPVSGNKGYLA